MKRIICIIHGAGIGSTAQRVASLLSELSQIHGVTVTTEDEPVETSRPRVNVGTIGHIDHSHKRILSVVTTLGILGGRMFDVPEIKLEVLKPEQTVNYQFPKLCRQHTEKARQGIKRFSLNPRVLKRPRGNFRCR